MQAKTIRKALRTKFDDFLESIKDSKVRDLVANNTIITGGSIASMLLGEDVNDYDLYFKNEGTVKAVASYYISRANIKWRGLGAELRVSDSGVYSVYIPSLGIKGTDDEDSHDYDISFISSNAISLKGKIQLILRFYGEPDQIHDNYDFIHCKNYWTSWDNILELHKGSLESLLSKTLHYTGSLYPVCSIMRAKKFLNRGWNINAGQYLKMCFQVSQLDLTDLEVLKEQLVGVDSVYFEAAIEDLQKKKEDDPDFKLDVCYITELVDRIF